MTMRQWCNTMGVVVVAGCSVLTMLVSVVTAQDAAPRNSFVYNDHGRRDPFLALVSPEGVVMAYDNDFSITDLILEGIVSAGTEGGLAIINGQVVKKGGRIGQFIVEAVMDDKVILRKGQEQFVVQLKKEN